MADYDAAAPVYARFRRPEPRWAVAIDRALGDAYTVVNVGAGTGNYEPAQRDVTPVEPSAGMIAARPTAARPPVRAEAEALPFGDDAFDAALGVLTVHHWRDPWAGLAELCRVARERVVLVCWDPAVEAEANWLLRDYLPELVAPERERVPSPEAIAAALDGSVAIEPLPVPHDCADGFLGAYWRRPERYLDVQARIGISLFAQRSAAEVEPGLKRLTSDLRDGSWQRRYADLLERDELDLGYRLVCARRES